MKATTSATLAAAIVLLASATQSLAIEGLQITVSCPDVILGWPSAGGESYIVQWRPNLSTPWVTLTDSLPGDWTTNWTVFVDSARVPSCPSGGDSMMMMSSTDASAEPSLLDSMIALALRTSQPLVIQNDGSGVVLPLGVYPPGTDLSAFTIFDASTGESVSGSGYVVPEPTLNQAQLGEVLLDEDDPEDPPPDPGFYQVVRVGAHVFGLTNGAVLSGIVSLPLEFGNPDTNGTLALLFLNDTSTGGGIPGVSFPDLTDNPAFPLTGAWDTMQVTNGTYTVQAGAILDDDTEYWDTPVTVTVTNLVWFPDPCNLAGDAIYIGVQTPYTDGTGTWHVDAYDDQGTFFGYLDGPIDQNGWFAYPGYTGPFSIDNTDGYGNQNPSTSYTLVYSTDAAHPIPSVPAWPGLTNKVVVEPGWNFFPSGAVFVYQPVFDDASPLGQQEIAQLAETMATGVEAGGHPPTLGSSLNPFALGVNGTWTNNVIPALRASYCRDFIWLGHGSGAALGSRPLGATAIREKTIAASLTNSAANPLKGPNQHPYRFVLMAGCNTADGDWPLAFGIPKQKKMTISDFVDKRGLRPRAFLGWSKDVQYRYVNAGLLELNFMEWTGQFYQKWLASDNLKQAVADAKTNPDYTTNTGDVGNVIYGAEDLNIEW